MKLKSIYCRYETSIKKIASLKRSIEQCEERATSITTAYNELPPQHNGAISQKVASNAERAVDYETDVKTFEGKGGAT